MAAVGIGIGFAFLLLAVLPLVVPLPPLGDTVSPDTLAGPDSRFAVIRGIRVHYTVVGEGGRGYLLFHGFGASTFSWREVAPTFARWGTAVAFDRPGFGLTERPPGWRGDNPYGAKSQVELALSLMESLGVEEAVLVGHSAGAEVALLTALTHPERTAALVLVAPALGGGGSRPGSVSSSPRPRPAGWGPSWCGESVPKARTSSGGRGTTRAFSPPRSSPGMSSPSGRRTGTAGCGSSPSPRGRPG